MQAEWQNNLELWLRERGYALRQVKYGHPREYKHGHVRVRINQLGIIILRDPGCTLQITGRNAAGLWEQISPNMLRIDYNSGLNGLDVMCRAIERFESRPAFTAEEAYEHFVK